MRLNVKVIAGSKISKVEEEKGKLKVHLTEHPVKGKANEALILLLSRHFNVKKSQVSITKGAKSSKKEVEIIGV